MILAAVALDFNIYFTFKAGASRYEILFLGNAQHLVVANWALWKHIIILYFFKFQNAVNNMFDFYDPDR